MKKHILAGIIIAGALATPVAQAAITQVDELYSGMSAAAIQKDQRANPAASRHSVAAGKATCVWHEAKAADQLYAPYPGNEGTFGEKDYLAAANFEHSC
jgi:hypothetical protein